MKAYIRRQQHEIFKHQDIKQKEPPQKYRLGTISNTKLLAGLNPGLLKMMSRGKALVNVSLAKTKGQDKPRYIKQGHNIIDGEDVVAHNKTHLRRESLTHDGKNQRQETVIHDTIQPRENNELHDTTNLRNSNT